MVQTPQAETFAQDPDEDWIPHEGLEDSLRLLGKHFNVDRDSLLILLEELIGYKHLRLQNQDRKLHRIRMKSGLEKMHLKESEPILKEDSDASERGTVLPSLRLKQRRSPKKNRRRVSKPEWLSSKAPMVKRKKSCDTKVSPSAASMFDMGATSNREDEPSAICLGYTLVDVNDKATIILFYHYCFASIGALCMKRILKAWIKAIHDKKQVTYPYKYGEVSKPPWWPTWIDDSNFNCRHKEPDHLQNKERLILAVWLLHSVNVRRLRRSTQQIAGLLEENHREIAMYLLNSLYDVRELEQGHEDGRGGHCQISLNVSLQKLQEKEQKKPVYRYPTEDKRRAFEMFLAQVEAQSLSLSYKNERMMKKRFARNSERVSVHRRYAYRDSNHQQNTTTFSSISPDIAVHKSTPPYTSKPLYLCEMNSLQGGVPPSSDSSNSSSCESPGELAMPSTIETGQAGMIAFKHEKDDTANFSERANLDTSFPLRPHASRSELQSYNAYPDTYGQLDLTAWPSTHLPIQHMTVPNSLSLYAPNRYHQMPESSADLFDVNIDHSDNSSELAAEELRWQPQMWNQAAFGATWPLFDFDRLLRIGEGA